GGSVARSGARLPYLALVEKRAGESDGGASTTLLRFSAAGGCRGINFLASARREAGPSGWLLVARCAERPTVGLHGPAHRRRAGSSSSPGTTGAGGRESDSRTERRSAATNRPVRATPQGTERSSRHGPHCQAYRGNARQLQRGSPCRGPSLGSGGDAVRRAA